MSSLTAKKIRGRTYYYLRETARVGGKPKVVRQVYLGSADEVVASLARGPTALEVRPGARVLEFGAPVALLDLASELDLVAIIDRHCPRRSNKGPSVGQMLTLAAINRAVAPRSKSQLAAWYEGTSLLRVLKLRAQQLTSQRFWDAMARVDTKALAGIERDLSARVMTHFDLAREVLFYDATNFFTFIDSFNARPTLAQRGDSKEGRTNLRILGLALLVTGDFQVPLFHRLYPGNHNDPTSFRASVGELVSLASEVLGSVEDLTLVFDKGNNTADTLESLAGSYHVVGSLVPSYHRDLLEVGREQMVRLDPERFPVEVRSHRTRKTVFGRDFTVLVVWNQGLYDAQRATLERETTKRGEKLEAERVRLARWQSGQVRGGHLPTVAAVQRRVANILKGRQTKGLFDVDVSPHPERPEVAQFQWSLSANAVAQLERTALGKTLLFTDRHEWSDEDIVTAYRGQHHVESAFRQMKDTQHLSFRPAYHWTDQKLRVHALTCVMALTLCSLLRRRLAARGLNLSIDAMLDALACIREVHVLLTSGRGRPRVRRTHSQLAELPQRLFDELDLGRHLSR